LDRLLLAWLALLAVWLAWEGISALRREGSSSGERRRALASIGLLGGAVAGYLLLPRVMLNGNAMHMYVYHRFAPLIGLLVPVCLPVGPGRVDRLVRLVVAGLAVTLGLHVALRMRDFDRDVAGIALLSDR